MTAPRFPVGTIVAGDPTIGQLRIRLFKGPVFNESTRVALANLVEVDSPGYEASPSGGWEDPELIDEDLVRRVSKSHRFACTGANAGCNALGYYVTAFDGTEQFLVDVQQFRKKDGTPDPKPMAAIGDNVLIKVELIVSDSRIID